MTCEEPPGTAHSNLNQVWCQTIAGCTVLVPIVGADYNISPPRTVVSRQPSSEERTTSITIPSVVLGAHRVLHRIAPFVELRARLLHACIPVTRAVPRLAGVRRVGIVCCRHDTLSPSPGLQRVMFCCFLILLCLVMVRELVFSPVLSRLGY